MISEVGHQTVRMVVFPIVNNSGNNNRQSTLPPCFIDESKSTPLPSTSIRYDPWQKVYNPVGIT